MTGEYVLLFAGVALVSAVGTWLVRARALSRGRLDYPNARSSHAVPTPRGGGLSIAAAVTAGAAVLGYTNAISGALAAAILVGGGAIALVGHLDDRSAVAVPVRLAVHAGSAVLAVALLGGLPPLPWGGTAVDLGLVGDILAVLAVIWVINLFNFMDGIDGLAASEAVFITAAGAFLSYLGGTTWGVTALALVVSAATFGFLLWNWPPAKIFMGDVGSGYLGYVVVVIALDIGHESAAALYAWLILGGVFFVDATVTLFRRLARGERIFEPHRVHGYQWLARRLDSHLYATATVAVINLAWLLPLAWWCHRRPEAAAWIVLIALAPVTAAMLAFGAGKPEGGAEVRHGRGSQGGLREPRK